MKKKEIKLKQAMGEMRNAFTPPFPHLPISQAAVTFVKNIPIHFFIFSLRIIHIFLLSPAIIYCNFQ